MKEQGYTYHNGILSIPARLLYEDWGLITYKNYNIMCHRGQLVRSRQGKGKGCEALLSYHDLPQEYKNVCIEMLNHPDDVVVRDDLSPLIKPDVMASRFFENHRNPDGRKLSEEKKIERITSCCILNALREIIENNPNAHGSKSKTKIWENLSDAVNNLPKRWKHVLPTSSKNLKIRYKRYLKEGYASFIHAGEGNQSTIKIKGDVADYILAMYCLPIKYTIPEVLAMYNEVKEENSWRDLSESAIQKFLFKTENERIWTLARDGKEAYNRKYKHTIKRDKSRWFPNVYWAIDGTKLDLQYLNTETGNVEAYMRIDVVFDVYSEKIIGYSLSETESMTDHFRAVKMAVQMAGVRPFLFTYDKQSGHISAKMQEIYSEMVAKDGGTHYSHKAREHNSPAEGIFRRLQQQCIQKLWNSDGLGITTKTDQSHANQDFLTEQKHHLPTKEDIVKQWEYIVKKWNTSKHFERTHKTRNEVYNEEMLVSEPLKIQELLKLMWIEEKKKPITYKAHGISVVVDKKEYIFEVYDENGQIDLEFRRKYVGEKFIVRYDPDAMDGHIQLLKENQFGEKYFVAYAQPKRAYEVVPKLMMEGEKEQQSKDFNIRMIERNRDEQAYKELVARTGISRERMIAMQEMAVKTQGRNNKKMNIQVDRSESLLNQL